jgi:hypothetical protein
MEEKQKVDKTSMGYKMGQFLFLTTSACAAALIIGLTAKLLIMLFS